MPLVGDQKRDYMRSYRQSNREYLRAYRKQYAIEHPDRIDAHRRAAILRRAVQHGGLPSAQSIKRYGITQQELIAVLKVITCEPSCK